METHTRKLLLHRFYADVNVKGGLGFCRALALFYALFALPLNVVACNYFRFAITLFTVDLEREKYYKLTFSNSDILLQHHNQLQ